MFFSKLLYPSQPFFVFFLLSSNNNDQTSTNLFATIFEVNVCFPIIISISVSCNLRTYASFVINKPFCVELFSQLLLQFEHGKCPQQAGVVGSWLHAGKHWIRWSWADSCQSLRHALAGCASELVP